MKRLFLLISVVLTTSLVAQETQSVIFNAVLSDIFNLNIVNGEEQTATFDEATDYDNGVYEGSGIVPGFTDVTMEATTNWSLDIKGNADFIDNGGQLIPINNLGVWVDETPATPIHTIGVEVSCSNIDPTTTLGITLVDQTLMNVGPAGSNAGNALENAFTLHWRMGTTDNATMNPETMFTQMTNGDFGPGSYSTSIILTMNPE